MALLDDIPGYREAVERERRNRNGAYDPGCERISGYLAVPLTLRRYQWLLSLESPLISGRTPSPQDLSIFLWLLSPTYSPEASQTRVAHFKRCLEFIPQPSPLFHFRWSMFWWKRREVGHWKRAGEVLVAARQFIQDTFLDSPSTGRQVDGSVKSYYADAVGLVALFSRDYRWSEDAVLDCPLKRIFQHLKEIKEHNQLKSGKNAILFNPSDHVMADWQARQAIPVAQTNGHFAKRIWFN